MRRLKEVDLDGTAIQVREMTVAEARAWLAGMDATDGDLLDVGFDVEGVSLHDLRHFTSADAATLDALTPAQLGRLAREAKELNPDFFRLKAWRQGLIGLGASPLNSAATSSAPPSA